MSITLDDDFDYTIDERRDAEDDGPALRPGYAPPPSLGEGTATFGAETADNDSEPFLTLRDRSRSTIDWNRFIRPATPEEIKAYDEWEAQRAKQGMGAVISQVFQDRRQAWEQTPDQAAHRMWLERQTGIPQRMMKDGDVLRTAEMRAQMGMDALTLHDAPEQVVSWLKTPGMLEIARDDLETLKKVGDALQQLAASKAPTRPGNKWKDFRSGIADALEGKADVREMQAAARMSPSVLEPEGDVGTSSGVMGLGRGFLASLPKEVRKDVAAAMSRAALSNADEWRSWAEWVRPDPYVLPKEGTFSRWLSDVVRGTPYTLTGMPVSAALTTGGAVLGGPLGATAGAALSSLIQTNGEAQLEQAHVWRELVDRGMDPAEAYDKSFNEVYLPNFGLLYLSNFLQDRLTFGVPMGRGAAYWVKRGGNLLLSSLFEGGEEIGQSLISNRALGEENDWGQLLYEGAVGVGVGLVFSGGGTALGTAMGQYREHRAEAGEARESTRIGAVMDEAVKAAEASRVRERSPEAFDDFVEYVGGQGQEKVNVDGAVFFQTFGEDAYAAAERLGIGDGLDEAARTGGAVEIPTAAILKNPDIYEKVKNDLRYSDDGMSRNEAQEFERTRDERNRADIDAAASAVRTVQEAGEKAERIRDGLRSQFEALGHKKVGRREAEFYSTIWTAAIANEARYAGVDIEEMARRPEWNLRFQYDRGTGDISRMQDVYTHPVNVGVDLGQKVPILDLSAMEGTSTPKELLTRLKDMALKDEAWISRDAEVFATLPRGKKLKHVAYSSRKAQIDGAMALERRNSIAGALNDLVQNAVLIESVPNNDPKKTDVLNFHRLYVPVRTDAGIQAVRIVAEELKDSDRLRPTDVEVYDVVLEGQKESLGVPNDLLAKEGVTAPGAPFELTIADMLRGVKDAEGKPYVVEEYRQSSVRQSEDYDPGDPKTWPEGPGRDEALMLEAWQNFEPDGEIETWPESPEKARALELQNESRQIDAWIENLSREEFDRRLRDDDPEFVWKNERGVELEKELRSLRRDLRKKKPKGAEGRLLQLIEAEEEPAAREAETYYQRQGEEKLAQDEKAWATLIDRFLGNELSGKEKGAPLPVMTTPLVLSLTGVEVLPVEIHARNLDKILNGKHEIAPETLKQIPRAIADPIMIFRSPADESKGRDSRVILTELTEKDAGGEDRSIVAAITLKRANTRHGYEINELTTVFRKDVSSRQNLTPELDVLDWMTRRHKDGSPMNLLLYLNRNKGLEWLDHTGTSPKASSLFQDPYVQSVPNEADLDNLRGTAPGFYQDADTPLGSTRFEEAETIVSILKDGNRSTFLHELGHVFLNSRKNLALMEGVDDTVRQDWTTLVEWLEVADIDFSKPLSETDEKRWRNAHEKFAAGFEKYLMEGKAPNLDLARAFRAFRKWLMDIYRAVRNVFYVDADGNRVEFEINDEIRGVMDRMLASEEEIAQATEARQLGEARKKLLEAGIPDDFVKEYEEAVWAATDASERQLFRILEGETSRDYRDRMKELRAQLTAEAREETAKVPRYRTAAFMREKGIKLSLKDLTDRYGLAATQDLPKGTAHVGGLQLDVAAEMLGYENADLLVEDLKAVKEVPFNEAVRRAVDESMRREESLLYNPEALRNAVDEALHVDERLAEILRRRELVMEKLGRDPRDEATRRTEGAATLAAVKEQAREIVQGKKIGAAASVRKWHTAELRSRSRALQSLDRARKALAEEDPPKASAALKDAREHLDMEALNHALVQEAMKARDEIEAGKRYTRRLWKNRKRLEAAVGEGNWAQVRGLMERFGFWRVENPEKSRHKAPLAEWADKLEVGGALLPDLVLQDGVGFDSPALMTFSQFSDLIQAVRTIEHVGRNERTLIIDGRRRERQALKERLIAEKVEHYGDLPPMDTDPNEGSGRLAGAKRLFLKYFSDLTAVEFMMRQMDKHKPLGSWWEAIFKPVSDAELREIEMKREMVSKVRELFARFPDAGAGLKEKVVTRLYNPRKSDYTPFTRENLLALALNMGTERNRQRVLGGWFPKLDMTDERAVQEAMGIVDSLLENLTDTDWEFVQGVWDLFDGYWPQVAALEKEVSGVTPEKERAVPVRTASGKVMRGGYFPIRYNPVKNLTAAKHQAEKLEKSLHETPYGRAAVAHGYTKGRMEVVNRQILFKLDTIAMHLNEVAHDLTHRMAVRDVSRLINDKELSAHLEHVLGRENYEQLNPWLQHIANSALSEKDVTAVDKMVRRGMSNIAAAYMGFKVSVGLKQIVGLGPAADQVGRLRLSKAMMQYLATYDKEAIRDEIFAKSTYMSDRANNFDRDIRGALSERTASTFSNREAGVRNMMFWWAGYMDTLVSIPTWLAAYHKALNDFAKETQDATALEAKAVEYADMVVRTTQNAGSPKDLAAIQRGGAMRKLFTMFYTGIGRLYNLTREEWHKGHGIRDIPRLTGHVLTVYTIPFLVGELLMNRAFGSGDDDDDSLLARLWWAGKGTLGEMMAPLVFVRDVANLFVTDYRYRATPLDEIGGSIERLVRMSRRAMDEDKEMDWTKFAKESTNAAGGLLGLPSRQIIATIRGIDNAIDKWDERGPWERLFGTPMDILMGPVKEKR